MSSSGITSSKCCLLIDQLARPTIMMLADARKKTHVRTVVFLQIQWWLSFVFIMYHRLLGEEIGI